MIISLREFYTCPLKYGRFEYLHSHAIFLNKISYHTSLIIIIIVKTKKNMSIINIFTMIINHYHYKNLRISNIKALNIIIYLSFYAKSCMLAKLCSKRGNYGHPKITFLVDHGYLSINMNIDKIWSSQ